MPWVDEQLLSAGAYWTVTPGEEHRHPRPVWVVCHVHQGDSGPNHVIPSMRPGEMADIVLDIAAGR